MHYAPCLASNFLYLCVNLYVNPYVNLYVNLYMISKAPPPPTVWATIKNEHLLVVQHGQRNPPTATRMATSPLQIWASLVRLPLLGVFPCGLYAFVRDTGWWYLEVGGTLR